MLPVWAYHMMSLNVKILWPLTGRVLLLLPNCAQNHMPQILACKVSATFIVQTLKGIQALFSLPLAWLLTTRLGVMLAASSKVKQISGMGTFLRFKRCAKSFNNTPVSIPSRIKVLEFDSLMRGVSKILFTRGEVLVESCWLISVFNVSLWYVVVCSGLYLVSSCFVTMDGLLLLL